LAHFIERALIFFFLREIVKSSRVVECALEIKKLVYFGFESGFFSGERASAFVIIPKAVLGRDVRKFLDPTLFDR
jgi:hypothetical protein